MNNQELTGFPSIDKPWLKYYKDPETFAVPKNKNYDYIYNRIKDRGDNIAIRYFSAKITYREMFQKVEAAAKALKALGVKEKEIVSVCLPNIPEVVYVYYAINRIGTVANMLDPRCNASTLQRSCKDAKSKLLVTLDMVLEKFIPENGNTVSAFDPDTGDELKYNEKGEIAIQGPTMMKGYFGVAAGETSSVLKKHKDGTLWVHTGDIGHIDENGVLYIDGRIKRMFAKNGYKIFAGEVENQIMRSGLAESCAVVAVPDNVLGFKEVAFVVLKSKANKADAEKTLGAFLLESLYDYEVPDKYNFVDELPLTGMNKIDFRALEKLAEKGE